MIPFWGLFFILDHLTLSFMVINLGKRVETLESNSGKGNAESCRIKQVRTIRPYNELISFP